MTAIGETPVPPKDEGLDDLTHRQFGDKVERAREQEGGPAGFDDGGEH